MFILPIIGMINYVQEQQVKQQRVTPIVSKQEVKTNLRDLLCRRNQIILRKKKTCFRCKSTGYLIANCPIKSTGNNGRTTYGSKSVKVNHCTVADYCDNDTSAPSGDFDNHTMCAAPIERA